MCHGKSFILNNTFKDLAPCKMFGVLTPVIAYAVPVGGSIMSWFLMLWL